LIGLSLKKQNVFVPTREADREKKKGRALSGGEKGAEDSFKLAKEAAAKRAQVKRKKLDRKAHFHIRTDVVSHKSRKNPGNRHEDGDDFY
jgi:hypothetical protein